MTLKMYSTYTTIHTVMGYLIDINMEDAQSGRVHSETEDAVQKTRYRRRSTEDAVQKTRYSDKNHTVSTLDAPTRRHLTKSRVA